jgi:hypothetical protein
MGSASLKELIMTLITEVQHTTLLANGIAARDAARAGIDFDPKPVVKLFTRNGCCRWLLTEIDPTNTDRAYGLCDNGDGRPELGFISLSKIEAPYGDYKLRVELDLRFVADKPLSIYADVAYTRGLIVT